MENVVSIVFIGEDNYYLWYVGYCIRINVNDGIELFVADVIFYICFGLVGDGMVFFEFVNFFGYFIWYCNV